MFRFILFLQYLFMQPSCYLSHFYLIEHITLADGSFIVITYNP